MTNFRSYSNDTTMESSTGFRATLHSVLMWSTFTKHLGTYGLVNQKQPARRQELHYYSQHKKRVQHDEEVWIPPPDVPEPRVLSSRQHVVPLAISLRSIPIYSPVFLYLPVVTQPTHLILKLQSSKNFATKQN